MQRMLAVGGDTIQRPTWAASMLYPLAAVLVLAALLVPLLASPAAAQTATLTETSSEVVPPGLINVRGQGFPSGETIEIRIGSSSSPIVTTASANSSGSFVASVQSAGLSPGSVDIQACACGVDPEVRLSSSVRVLGYAQATIVAPSTAISGDTVTLDASNATDPGGEVIAWECSIINNATGARISATGPIVEVTLPDPGLHDVQLTLIDSDFLLSGDSTQINVTPPIQLAPVAVASVPTNGTVGVPVRVSSSSSSDSDGSISSRLWEFGDGGSARSTDATHTWNSPGQYTVSLRVTDNDQLSDTTTRQINIAALAVTAGPNQRPVADAGRTVDVVTGTAAVFDGRDSFDPDGSIVSWSWSFGDANSGTGPRPRHSYSQVGTYTATVTVTDDDGATNTDTVRVNVTAAPVTEEPAPPPQTTGAPGGTVAPQTTVESEPDPPPTAPDGGSLPSTTLPGGEVTTINLGGPYEVTVGENLSISGPRTIDDSDIESWTWSFTDGSGAFTERDLSRNFTGAGRYTVSLAVSAENGSTGFGSAIVTVRQLDLGDGTPIPDIGGPYTPIAGEPILLDASRSTDLDGEIVNWEWNVGEASLLIGETVEHTFEEDGDFPIILRVTDDSGATAITVTTVEVFPVECSLSPELVDDFRGRPRTATTAGALTTFRLVVAVDCAGLQIGFAVDGEVLINPVPIGPAGLAEASIRMPENLVPGEHELTAIFGDENLVLAESTWQLAGSDGAACDLAADEVGQLEARPSGNGIRVSIEVNRTRACPLRAVTLRIVGGPSSISPEPFTLDGSRSSRLIFAPGGVEPGDYEVEILAGGEVLSSTTVEVTESEGNRLNLIAILVAAALTATLLAVAVPIFLRRF